MQSFNVHCYHNICRSVPFFPQRVPRESGINIQGVSLTQCIHSLLRVGVSRFVQIAQCLISAVVKPSYSFEFYEGRLVNRFFCCCCCLHPTVLCVTSKSVSFNVLEAFGKFLFHLSIQKGIPPRAMKRDDFEVTRN